MKKLMLIVMLLATLIASADVKIKTDEIDEFTGKRTLITSDVTCDGGRMHLNARYQNGEMFLDVVYPFPDAVVVNTDCHLIFKNKNNGNMVSLSPIKMYSGDAEYSEYSGAYTVLYATYQGDLDWFKSNVPHLFRIYTTDGYLDKKISEKDGLKIQDMFYLFFNSLSQEPKK
jgi:hypothetical protein